MLFILLITSKLASHTEEFQIFLNPSAFDHSNLSLYGQIGIGIRQFIKSLCRQEIFQTYHPLSIAQIQYLSNHSIQILILVTTPPHEIPSKSVFSLLYNYNTDNPPAHLLPARLQFSILSTTVFKYWFYAPCQSASPAHNQYSPSLQT